MQGELDKAFAHFKTVDAVLYGAAKKHKVALVSSLSRQAKKQGKDKLFTSLGESVVSQQLSVKASDTIWARVKMACGGTVTPTTVSATSLVKLRRAGLSAAKAKTLKELSKAVQKGLDLPALRKKTKEEATEALTKVWGIGPWTAEMFLMFGLGHPDIFSSRDLGLVRSMEALYNLPRGVSVERLETIAMAWSPHRTVACRILWRARDATKD